jgi:ABC-2 type transport system permease protein
LKISRALVASPRIVSKYGHVFNVGVQRTLVYRVNFLFRACFGLIPLAATLFLWRAIFEGKDGGSVAAYSLAQMTSYYLLVTVVDMLTAVADDDWQIAADIREGTVSQFLLKPIDYLYYRFCLFISGRLIYTVTALVPVAVFILWLRDYVVWPADAVTLGCFAVSVVLTGLLQFLISFTMALLAFWVLEVSTFIFIVFAFEYLAGGHLFPLDILPPALAQVLSFTPFPYQMYFPVSIYLGRTTGSAVWQGLLVQAFWVVASYVLARWVWRRGIRRYAAFGG